MARWTEAKAQFAEALRLLELGPCRLWAAQTHAAWGTTCRGLRDLGAAREHWEKAAGQWKASGVTWEPEKVRALLATLPETLCCGPGPKQPGIDVGD